LAIFEAFIFFWLKRVRPRGQTPTSHSKTILFLLELVTQFITESISVSADTINSIFQHQTISLETSDCISLHFLCIRCNLRSSYGFKSLKTNKPHNNCGCVWGWFKDEKRCVDRKAMREIVQKWKAFMIRWMNGRGSFFVIKKKKDEQKKNYRVWKETQDLGWGSTSGHGIVWWKHIRFAFDWLICFKI